MLSSVPFYKTTETRDTPSLQELQHRQTGLSAHVTLDSLALNVRAGNQFYQNLFIIWLPLYHIVLN